MDKRRYFWAHTVLLTEGFVWILSEDKVLEKGSVEIIALAFFDCSCKYNKNPAFEITLETPASLGMNELKVQVCFTALCSLIATSANCLVLVLARRS